MTLRPLVLVLVLGVGCTRTEPSSSATNVATATAAPRRVAGAIVLPPNSPMLTRITRQPVRLATLPTDELIAPGTIEVNPNRVSRVVLPVTGRVTAVSVHVGDLVTKDQPLVRMQSPDADAAMSAYLSSEAAVTQAKAARLKAQSDYDRATDLFQHNAVAQKDVLTAESALAQAVAGSAQATASREQAFRRLSVLGLNAPKFEQEVTLRAPIAGKILDLSVVPGEYRNDTTMPVMTIADLATVWVTSEVPESYIRFVQVGEPLEITLVAYPGETFRAQVARIADTVDPKTRTVKVHGEMDNPMGRFRPQMYGTIHHIESMATIPVVPVTAVVQDGQRSVVFVETAPGHFEERAVSVGRPAGDVIRILGGLNADEQVVVDGAMLVKGMEAAGQP